jgi:rhodanese-related sulfurtransferase
MNRSRLFATAGASLAACVAAFACIVVSLAETKPSKTTPSKTPAYRVVTAQEAHTILSLDTSIVVVDVRTKEEFDGGKGHLKNARLIPVGELPKRWKELQSVKERQLLVYCCQCPRSAEASEILTKQGFKRILKMDGGIDTWTDANYPVEVSAGAPADKSKACSYRPASASKPRSSDKSKKQTSR